MPRPLRKAAPLGLVLDAASHTPLHRQIGEQVRRAILERRLAPGQRLPSSRLMASELEVARGTVLLAMDQLIAEGYVVAQAASGLSVANDLPDDMLTAPRGQIAGPPARDGAATSALSRRARTALRDAMPTLGFEEAPLAFPTGQPDREAFPFALWARLLEREWRQPSWVVASALHPFGHPGLRAAIADYLGAARGFACTPASIVVTTGVRQSLSLLAWLVLDADDAAWIEEPGFVGTREALALAGVHAVPVPVDEQGFAVERALAAEPQAKLAVVAPAHHFPLGTVLGLQRRLELLSWAERHKGWIAEDDYRRRVPLCRPAARAAARARSQRPRGVSRQLLQAALPGAAAELCRAAGDARPGRGKADGGGAGARLIGRPGRAGPLHRRRPFRRSPAPHASPLRHPPGGAFSRSRAPPRAGWRAHATPAACTWSRGRLLRSPPPSTTARSRPLPRRRGSRCRRCRPAMPAAAASMA